MKWSTSRRKELELLRQLLIDIGGINHGSNALGKIEKCIKIAKKLFASDINRGRSSFFQFVVENGASQVSAATAPLDAKRWRYGVQHGFPSHNAQVHPVFKNLGWRMPSQEPPNGKTYDADDYPYYQTAGAAIDAEMSKRRRTTRARRSR